MLFSKKTAPVLINENGSIGTVAGKPYLKISGTNSLR